MIRLFVFLFILFLSAPALAQYRLLDVEEFSIQYSQFEDGRRDPYAPEYDGQWAYRANANFRLSIFESLYWDNNVHTEALQSGPVKTVGWHWKLGLRLTNWLDIGHEHWSRHIMEDARPKDGGSNVFPVEDSYFIRVKFIQKPNGRSLGGWIGGGQ